MAAGQAAAEVDVALRRLLLAGREMQGALARRLGVRGIDVAAVDHVVSAVEPIGTVELGQRLGIRSASAAVLVDRLVTAGHLHREAHPDDRRRVRLGSTEHARSEVRQALAPLLEDIAALTERLDEEQTATLLWFLSEAAATMRAYAAGSQEDP
jgi:DNA-binding MarR family transcriptional regulator